MVINPANSSHTLNIIPRYYPDKVLVVALFNEATRVTTTPTPTYNVTNGKLNVTFTFTFVDKDRHQIKITEGTAAATDPVVYRGKLLTTTQSPQEFKQTNGLYIYSS